MAYRDGLVPPNAKETAATLGDSNVKIARCAGHHNLSRSPRLKALRFKKSESENALMLNVSSIGHVGELGFMRTKLSWPHFGSGR